MTLPRARPLPTKILGGNKHGHIQSQGCEGAKQKGVAPGVEKRFGEQAGLPDGGMPFSPILGNAFKAGLSLAKMMITL